MAGKQTRTDPALQQKLLAAGRLVALLGVLLAVGLASAFIGMRLAVRGTEVEVPSLMGHTVEDATRMLGEFRLRPEVIGERFDPIVPLGAILSQRPEAGRNVKVHGNVQVIVSRGEKAEPVPDLRNSSLRVARLVASQSGFELGNITEVSMSGVPEGQIVQQYPRPNAREIIGPQIDVLLSGGGGLRYVMPDVTGQSLNGALRFLEKNDLNAGNIQYVDTSGAARGTIVRQFPEPGHMLTGDESVNLRVAR